MRTIKFNIEGTQPMMWSNPQTVNPFNKYTVALKPLTAKRKKTDEDHIEICRIKFEASLYIKNGIYVIPCDHFWKSICTAAKELKLGAKFERSFIVVDDCPLEFPEKGMTPDQLWEDKRHVDIRDGAVSGSRITACRAIFAEWSTTLECIYDETQIDESQVINIIDIAGKRYGVGTYRKKYGRFKAKKI